MDFSWKDEEIRLRDDLARFAREELSADVLENDRKGRFDRGLWKKCAEHGILGYSVPERYGGQAPMPLPSAMLAMEGFGYGCRDNGLAFGLNAQLWTVQLPIVEFGTDEQKERFLPSLCSGESIGAHAITEPDTGSDAFNLETRAAPVEGGYMLNGKKWLITFAPVADVALVLATTDPELGKWGVTAFLVECDRPGFSASPVHDKMGLRTVPIGAFEFNDCFIPEANRLGPEGGGVSLSSHSLQIERCCILASQLGAMQRQLEEAVEYARSRTQFGQRIGRFQSVSNRIADMKLRLETSRLLLYKVAWQIENGIDARMESALLKLHLSESFVASGLDAIRIHGGNGYLTEFEVERDLRDAIGGTLYAGTSDIQRNLIARILGV
ncbi:MAG: acyl-CoA dehydrogenase [Rhodothermales bacterium]|nr:acyl-CoA dehydrogenase [Rhodothermales bacterium]